VNKAIDKYLKVYAEHEVNQLDSFPADISFKHAVVIPAYKESSGFIERFVNSKLAEQESLMILVVNQPESETSNLAQARLFDSVLAFGTRVWQSGELSLVNIKGKSACLLLVDRFNRPIPEKQGVGLARKIGVDLALAMVHKNILASSWIHSSDADAHLPHDYFSATAKVNNAAVAACFNFTHVSDNQAIHKANQEYERALRYFVAGLDYAESGYAFFTIGSILVFDATAYAKVRGFPKRSAGEDFYLLNKLAKLGRIDFLPDTEVTLDARVSDRVPFGTGPAVGKILTLNQQGLEYHYYHPLTFHLLKECLRAFQSLWQYREQLENWLALQSDELSMVLTELDINAFVTKHHASSQVQFNKQLNVWFDAFKTLKFIHAARDNFYPDLPLEQAMRQASFYNSIG